jgi:large subunit ribosomal protein L21
MNKTTIYKRNIGQSCSVRQVFASAIVSTACRQLLYIAAVQLVARLRHLKVHIILILIRTFSARFYLPINCAAPSIYIFLARIIAHCDFFKIKMLGALGRRSSLLGAYFRPLGLELEAFASTSVVTMSTLSAVSFPLFSLRDFTAPRGAACPLMPRGQFYCNHTLPSATASETRTGLDTPAAARDRDVYSRLSGPIMKAYRVTPKGTFAVVEVGGTQYKVTPDDVIITEKLHDVDVNDRIRLQRVLMLGSATETVIGRPCIPGVSVVAGVEEQFLDGKVIIFHKRRRKNSRRTRGHRQPLTKLRIIDIEGFDP